MYEEISKEFVDLIVLNVIENGFKFNEKLDDFVEKVVYLGWLIYFVIIGLCVFGFLVYIVMRDEDLFLKREEKFEDDVYYCFEIWFFFMYNKVVIVYVDMWEKIVFI